jgi:hypothetical protein
VADPPDIIWAIAGIEELWTGFAALAQPALGIMRSETELELVISIQRDFVGVHGTRFAQAVF